MFGLVDVGEIREARKIISARLNAPRQDAVPSRTAPRLPVAHGVAPSLDNIAGHALELLSDDVGVGKRAFRERVAITTGAFLLAGAVAVFLGLQTLYQDKPAWGTGWDMAGAVLWGLALGSVQYVGVGALASRVLGEK